MPVQGGGLAQMLAEQGGDEDLVKTAQEVEDMPGGPELLYTFAAEEMMKAQGIPKKKYKKVRLYEIGGYVKKQRGGSVHGAAQKTRRAGRGDDSMMLHMSPEEYEVITSMWGEPDVNPNTGIGEYGFLSKLWKKVKKGVKKIVKSKIFQVVAPIALSVFAPGLGTAIGAALGASGTAASVVGNAIVQGGLGAITGGKKGAIAGVIGGATAGGLGRAAGRAAGLTGKTADIVGSALVRGGGSALTGEGFMPGAIQGGLSAYMQPMQDKMAGGLRETFGLDPLGQGAPPIDPSVTVGGVPQIDPSVTVGGGFDFGNLAKYALPIATGLSALSGGREYEEAEAPPPPGGNFGESLPVYSMNRQFQGLPNEQDYFTYGQVGAPQSGQHLFITPPSPFAGETGTPTAPGQARGGYQRGGEYDYWEQNEDVFDTTNLEVSARGRYVKGEGHGREDAIPAKLSDGEYVIDAESVSLLGDGSGDAGARRLDEMRTNLRKHKGKNLTKGEFSHKAKTPENYMRNVKRLRRKSNYEHGGLHNVANGGTI